MKNMVIDLESTENDVFGGEYEKVKIRIVTRDVMLRKNDIVIRF